MYNVCIYILLYYMCMCYVFYIVINIIHIYLNHTVKICRGPLSDSIVFWNMTLYYFKVLTSNCLSSPFLDLCLFNRSLDFMFAVIIFLILVLFVLCENWEISLLLCLILQIFNNFLKIPVSSLLLYCNQQTETSRCLLDIWTCLSLDHRVCWAHLCNFHTNVNSVPHLQSKFSSPSLSSILLLHQQLPQSSEIVFTNCRHFML